MFTEGSWVKKKTCRKLGFDLPITSKSLVGNMNHVDKELRSDSPLATSADLANDSRPCHSKLLSNAFLLSMISYDSVHMLNDKGLFPRPLQSYSESGIYI